MENKKPYNQFLFADDTQEKEIDFESVCNYGFFPINEPMNIDEHKFTFKNGFLNKLGKLYDNIKNEGEQFRIKNVHEIFPKLFIRDILTDYTITNIFGPKTQNSLIHIINKVMKSMYDQFFKETKIRLYFIYRGGNILKMYKNTFESILPGVARKIFKEEFDPFFKNSDIDFYTVIKDADKMSMEEIYIINNYIQMMCYYGVYISRIFVMNNFDLFQFCKYNKVTMKDEFQKLLNEMNEDKMESEYKEIREAKFIGLGFNEFMYTERGYDIDKIMKLPKSKIIDEFIHNVDDFKVFETYKEYKKSGRLDINISPAEDGVDVNSIDYFQENIFKQDYQKYMEDLVEKNGIFDYYISNNNKIVYKDEYVDFSLVRLMVNYVVVYERKEKFGLTNASSELFDLSIGHPEDKMFKVYNADSIVPYEFKYNGNLKDTIYVPSIQTTIVDLTKILFENSEYPWEDMKYEKRLYRLLILLFVENLSNHTLSQMERILKSKKKRKYKNEYDTTFETLKYRNQDEIRLKLDPKYKTEYKEYLKKYSEIVKKLLNVIQKLKMFVHSERIIAKGEINKFES